MRWHSAKFWTFGTSAILVAVSGCNGILGNDPRSWEGAAGEGGGPSASGRGGTGGVRAGAGGKGGSSGKGGSGGKGGSSGKGGTSSGGGGASGKGGTSGGEPAAGGAFESGGEAGDVAGVAGAGAADAGAGGGRVCECQPGEMAMNPQSCGDCMTGMQVQTKTCQADCTWGPFGDFGECTGVTATCTPGTPGSQNVACPCGGTKSQARTCTDACEWSGWTDTSGCDLECCSEIVYCNTPDDISPASRGTWCRRTASGCSNEEVSADCYEDIGMVCGAVVHELYIQY